MWGSDRAVLIRRDEDGPRVGSGLRVADHFVLTADHCAAGSNHRVVVGGVEYPASVHVRTGRRDVDLAVLTVDGLSAVPPLRCGRVDRSVPARILGCVALGYPRWKMSGDVRQLAQVEGDVPTAEGLRPSENPDAPTLITLKATGPAINEHPIPSGNLEKAGIPWGGMSGAVVVAGDVVVGVVRSHNLAEGFGSLTLTSLDAVEHLPPDTAARFWAALAADPAALVLLPDTTYRDVLDRLSPSGRPWRVEQADLSVYGVRRARADVDRRDDPYFPYVPWHVDEAVRNRLDERITGGDTRLLLLVGEAMAGKSRAGAEAIRSAPALADRWLLVPRRSEALRDVADLVGPQQAVLWLDDLDQYFPWLYQGVVDQWRATAGLVVVATVRTQRLAELGQDPDGLQAAWKVIGDDSRVDRLRLDADWTTTDQQALASFDPQVRDAVAEGRPLGKVLGAADELRLWLEFAPVRSRALVDAVGDWSRTGLGACPVDVAVAIWPHYLPAEQKREHGALAPQAAEGLFAEARDWVRDPVAETGIAPVRWLRDGLVADDYIVATRERSAVAVPGAVWGAALERAQDDPDRLFTVGYRAAASGAAAEFARRAWQPLAEAGDTGAQYDLGVLLADFVDPPDLDGARRWYAAAAEAGHSYARSNLGLLLADRVDPPNLDGARHWLTAAAETGHTDAQYNLGWLFADRVDPPDLDGARHWYTRAAEAGHTDAQYNLGLLLADRVNPPDLDGARHWYTAAAEAGQTRAQVNLGLLLADHLDPPDLDGARHWLTAAADAGHADAQSNLGVLLAERLDPPDLDGARHWLTAAADAGHTDAQYNLGVLLAERLDPPDLDGARWFTAAAEAGHTDAQYNLGLLLADHLNPPNLDGARHWLTAAAEAGHTAAQLNLGVLLANLDPPDLDGARHWWTLAAEAGHTDAQYNLGLLLADHLNPPNLDGARHWLTAAADAGDIQARRRLGRLRKGRRRFRLGFR